MNADNMRDLARVRYERAVELIAESKDLLNSGAYKSANNRAYYAAEKAIKSLLALTGRDAETHSGILKSFNMLYIKEPRGDFKRDDYMIVQKLERIRSLSDYDDFYVTSRSECENQVLVASAFVEKTGIYLKEQSVL